MERDSFYRVLRAFQQRVPFRPFTITLVNGNRVEVDRPDALVVRDGVGGYLGPGGVPVLFDFEGVRQVASDLPAPGEPGGGEGLPG